MKQAPSMEPKTVEDYRDITKILKLKIVKQAKKIEELQLKCRKYQDQINNATLNMTSREQLKFLSTAKEQLLAPQLVNPGLKQKSMVMRLFLKGAKQFGITLQSIYRIADINYTNCIESDYFRNVLSKMILNLSPKQISCLIFIFDQSCTGYITRDDYYNSLQAYQVGLQEKCLPYTQQCLLHLTSIIMTQRINASAFFDQMKKKADKNNRGLVDANVFEQHIKQKFADKLHQRQIVGSFNEIDLQKQQCLDKTNFIYCINSFINRLQIEERSKIQSVNQNGGQPSKLNFKSSQSEFKQSNNTNNNNNSGSNYNSPSKKYINQSIINIDLNAQNKVGLNAQSILSHLQKQYNIKAADVFQHLLSLPLQRRLTLTQMKKGMLKMNENMSAQIIIDLFRILDRGNQGSIHLKQIISYCLQNFKEIDIIFKFIGKYLAISELDSQGYWFVNNVQHQSMITKNAFCQKLSKDFESKSPELWEFVWNYFDKGRGTVNVDYIIKVWEKYQTQ